ncbi:MAG: hypothetical protein IT440_07035 [Phycisphaeraceae bacterium]|nr:hypothetical protein [Phycisphaeraceae bacterium]
MKACRCWNRSFSADCRIRVAWAGLWTMATLMLGSCAQAPPAGDAARPATSPLPRLDLDRYREPVSATGNAAIESPVAISAMILELPQPSDDVEQLWSQLDGEAALAPQQAALHSNGLRAGWLSSDRMILLQPLLAKTISITRQQMLLQPRTPVSAWETSPNPAAFRCLAYDDGLGVRSRPLSGGRLRWLLQLVTRDAKETVLQLAPQHHIRFDTFKPRTFMETQLQGVVFDAAGITWKLSARQALVVAPRPVTQSATTQPASPATQPADGEAPATQPAAAAEVECPRLGQVLLQGRRGPTPTQRVMILLPLGD